MWCHFSDTELRNETPGNVTALVGSFNMLKIPSSVSYSIILGIFHLFDFLNIGSFSWAKIKIV